MFTFMKLSSAAKFYFLIQDLIKEDEFYGGDIVEDDKDLKLIMANHDPAFLVSNNSNTF